MSTDRQDARHPLEVLLAEVRPTIVQGVQGVDNPPETGWTPRTEVTPQFTRKQVADMLVPPRSTKTIQRYQDEYSDCLTAQQDPATGAWLYSQADVEFLQQISTAKSKAACHKIAETRREQLAQLCAGVRRPEAEQINRELRAYAETEPTVARRVTRLLERRGELVHQPIEQRVAMYYRVYHPDRPRIDDLANGVLPKWATVERAFRRCR